MNGIACQILKILIEHMQVITLNIKSIIYIKSVPKDRVQETRRQNKGVEKC